VRKAQRYLRGRVLILLYHRVAEAGSDPWQLAVSPRHFEEHLQILSEACRPLRLRDLSGAVEKGSLPRRRVVVTFDDGYADNLLNAKPLLEKYDVPATVFITTGYTGKDREFWWDELDRLFLQPGVLPETLSLRVNGDRRYWELGDGAEYDTGSHERDQEWRAHYAEEPTPRHTVYRSLWEMMHPMRESERLRLRDDLLAWTGDSGSARETHRVLNSEQIIELTRTGLIEAGSHTVTHPKLAALGTEAQREEILQSKHSLEEIVGYPVTGFAYPYGRECDYALETVTMVRDAGFDCACTTSAGYVERPVDPFRLPRVAVQDMDGESFARLISEGLDQ
jgi:peptidoglycan/xylan/chitin deacetylase (PgdA/CDA1 family)